MSQHQQAFLADSAEDVARIARRVLSLLATVGNAGNQHGVTLAALPQSLRLREWVEQLHAASIGLDPATLSTALDDCRYMGCSDDTLTNEVIPAVARQLGISWKNDIISFADVTIGCARLQTALRRMPDEDPCDAVNSGRARRNILVMVQRGAQHTLGAVVLARQLRRAGQAVTVELETDGTALAKLAAKRKFDAVLLSASQCECPDDLRDLVRICRGHWTAAKVVLGGSINDLGTEIAGTVEADHLTNECKEAIFHCT